MSDASAAYLVDFCDRITLQQSMNRGWVKKYESRVGCLQGQLHIFNIGVTPNHCMDGSSQGGPHPCWIGIVDERHRPGTRRLALKKINHCGGRDWSVEVG